MITDIKISYFIYDIEVNLVIPKYEVEYNLPYDLANVFSRLVKDANVNPALVIEEMKRRLKVEE